MDTFILLMTFLHPVFSLFREEHMVTITAKSPPYVTRVFKHIYYIGTIDNGTLDCEMPGAVTYRWVSISKEEISEGGYVYSWEDDMKLTDPSKPSTLEISRKNYQTSSALIQCQGKNGYNGDVIAERLWVITRLHSPWGYPTDPLVCGLKLGNCFDLRRRIRQECMYDIGTNYAGTVAKTKTGEDCQMWNTYYRNQFLDLQDIIGEKPKDKHDPKYKLYYMARGTHRHLNAHKEHSQMRAEHNYCRGFTHNYLHPHQLRPPECVRMSANRFYEQRVAKPGKELVPCDVPVCSQCMYGDGKGNFPPYEHFRLAGAYNGTLRETFRRYKGPGGKTKFRTCYMAHSDSNQYALWYRLNRCHYKLSYPWNNKREADRPSCFVWKGVGAFEKANLDFKHSTIKKYMTLARCRIRQCTVRLVWFLFYNEDEEIVIDIQSSKEPRKFVFIEGTKAVIKYYAFGIHFESGMKVLPLNKTKSNIVQEWTNKVQRVPKVSELKLSTTVKREYAGKYYFLYHFEEADPTIELGTYSQMFDIEVRKPLTISLSPLNIHICEFEEGEIRLETHGDFEVLTQDIQWSYAFTKKETPTIVTLKTTFVKISENGRLVRVSRAAFIFVKVHWKHGKKTAEARVFVTGKPRLQNVSPLLTITYPGSAVKLALATDSRHNKLTWVHDAQKIEEIPDQANMAFSQKRTTKDIIYVLTIDNIRKEQFGVYTIKAVNTKNCRHSIEFIVRKPVEDTVYSKTSEDGTTSIPLSNSSLSQFKAVMDFMQSDCAEIIGQARTLQANDGPSTMLAASYCISLQHPKPYFELIFVNLTRIKGLRISQILGSGSDGNSNGGGLRLMYTINGCKWKIFGARPKLPQFTVSNTTNENFDKTKPKKENIPQNLIQKLESRYESKVFTMDGSLQWIGNTSLIFAKRIRLLPVNISGNESCIRLYIYGCSAELLETAKPKPIHSQTAGVAVVLGVFGGLVGTIVAIGGSWYIFKRWNIIMNYLMKISWYIIRDDSYQEGYYVYYELSESEESEEHIYCEIQDLESVPDNVVSDDVSASTDEK